MDRSVTEAVVLQEIAAASELAELHGWHLRLDRDNLILTATLSAHDGERFEVRGVFDDYREKPPRWTFVDLDSWVLDTPAAFPKGAPRDGTASIFIDHNNAPVICLPCNRLAYGEFNGPHGAWAYSEWDRLEPRYGNISAMLLRFQTELWVAKGYEGRRASRATTR